MNLTINVIQTDYTTEQALVVDIGGITINGTSNSGADSTFTLEVTDNTEAVISVSQTGFLPVSFTVNSVYTSDKTIEVILLPEITDIEDPNYLRLRPSFAVFNDPCSFCVDYYYASSAIGNTSWYINNELLTTGTQGRTCFTGPADYQIKVRTTTNLWDQQFATILTGNTTAGTIGELDIYLSEDTETNLTISEYRVSISLTTTSDLEPTVENDATCYLRSSEVTVTPNITLFREGSLPENYTITWEVRDPDNNLVSLFQDTFTLDLAPNLISAIFTLSKLGEYTATATIEDLDCSLTYQETTTLNTCNFIDLNYEGCNTFELSNKSTTPLSYQVTNVDSTYTEEGDVFAGSSTLFSFTEDDLYTVTITYVKDEDLVEEIYILNAYCNIEDCISEYIEMILCGKENRCSPCLPEVDLNQILLLYNLYFMKINKILRQNTFFTVLEGSNLDEITETKQVLDQLKSFCKANSCQTTGAFSTSQASGPYDWAGQGSNISKNCNCSTKSNYYNPINPGHCNTCGGKT